MTVTLKDVDYINKGDIRVDRIIENEETLRDAVNDRETDASELVEFINKYLGFGSCSFAIDTIGRHTAIAGDKHPDMRLTHCYAQIGSNVQADDSTIQILLNGSELLADPIRFVASETKGKIRVGVVMEHIEIMRSDSVEIEIDTNQTIAVYMNFEPKAVA